MLAAFGGAIGKALKPLRAWAAERLGLGYKAARTAHGLAALAVVALFVHLSLASSSDLSFNPAGPAWLAAWTLLSLGIFARSRVTVITSYSIHYTKLYDSTGTVGSSTRPPSRGPSNPRRACSGSARR